MLRVGDAGREHAGDGDHLERRARRLQASRPMPATARICPVDGLHRDDPAELAAERGHRGSLQRGGDGGADGRRRMGRCVGERDAAPRAARRPGCRAGDRRARAPGRSRRRSRSAGTPSASSAWRRAAGIGPTRPEHRARQIRRAASCDRAPPAARPGAGFRGTFGQHAAVAGQQRRAPRQRRCGG